MPSASVSPPVMTCIRRHPSVSSIFSFNDTAPTEIYTLSLHDALPILPGDNPPCPRAPADSSPGRGGWSPARSEEHTSELQLHHDLVCRLLLEKKKKQL